MAKLTHVSVVLVGVVAGTAALAAVMSTGCSSSTSSSSVDSGTDGTASQFDGSQTQFDGSTGQADAPTGADVVTPPADGGTTDGAIVDGAADGPDLGLGTDGADAADAEDAGDAPTACTTIIGLTGPVAAPDAGPTTDAGDAAAEASAAEASAGDAAAEASATDATAGDATSEAAADAAASDATTDAAASDATTGDAAASDATTGDGSPPDASAPDAPADAGPLPPVLLFGFDGVTGAAPPPWTVYSPNAADAGFAPVLGSTSTDGNTCLGALTVTSTFTEFGQQVDAQVNYAVYPTATNSLNWTGRTTLHFSVKVTASTADFAELNGVQAFISSGDGTASGNWPYYRASNFINAATFNDGAFHPVSVDLTGAPDAGTNPYDPTQVDQIGVQLLIQSAVDGGPTTLPSAVLLVDDIWLE